jgi:hypothetical protein
MSLRPPKSAHSPPGSEAFDLGSSGAGSDHYRSNAPLHLDMSSRSSSGGDDLSNQHSRRRKSSIPPTTLWPVFVTGVCLHGSILVTNYTVFEVLGGEREIQFAALLWGILNTGITCTILTLLRACLGAGRRSRFDETIGRPVCRLWIGLMVAAAFTWSATHFNLPPWPQLRFSIASYPLAIAWSFSILSTFQLISAE